MRVGGIVSFELRNRGVLVSGAKQEEKNIIIGTIGFQGLKKETIEVNIFIQQDKQTEDFKGFELHIPDYQRPYAWEEKQVEILLNDLKDVIESKKESYLLGSLILHKEERGQNGERQKYLNIVDGQQRLVTLALICAELKQWSYTNNNWTRKQNNIEVTDFFLKGQEFIHSESQRNLKNNFAYIRKWFERNQKEVGNFQELLESNKIEFVCIVTLNLDDAFIFFDSANSRGKKLEDYDLVKAYHLREVVEKKQESSLPYYAKLFEEMAKDSEYLSFFFEQILAPARLWLRDRSDLVAGDMKIYDEFCKEIPKGLARANRSNQNMGILSSFAGGVDFFLFLQRFDNLLKTLKNYAFYQDLEKIGGAGFGYARNLYVMVAMIYLDKFPCGRADYMLLLLARAVFEIRIHKESIRQATVRDYAKEVLPLVYFTEFEEELEYNLLVFIREKDKEEVIGKHNGGKEDYLNLVQREESKYPYSKQNIPFHREYIEEKEQ